jgi:CHAT domain-containing protein
MTDLDMAERDLDSQINTALARLNAFSKKANKRDLGSANLILAQLYLQKGMDSGDRTAYESAIEHVRQGFEHSASNSVLRATLRAVRGTALCKLYEIDGDLSLLNQGLADLRRSYTTLQHHKSVKAYHAVSEDLAVSLVRAGEQTGDIALLREGFALAEILLAERRPKRNPDELYRLINAHAVAQVRIGSYGADTALVEAAIQTLRTYLTSNNLSTEAKQQTWQNLCAALIENARQTRSERVYRELLSVLFNLSHPIQDSSSAYFAQYYAQVSTELLGLTGDIAVADQAINTLEELLKWDQLNPFRRLEALHSLAQSHFQVGKLTDAERHFTASIQAIEKALVLVNSETMPTDSRGHRLIAALGAYKFALGLTIRKPELIQEAADHYVSALDLVSPVKAPSLFVDVAKGLFHLYYQQKRWDSALEVFESTEDAWSKIIADPHLSWSVHLQGARQLAGEYTRAAWIQVQKGDLTKAALTLDRGRARQLNAALNVDRQNESRLPPLEKERLNSAARAVETARLSASEDVSRRAWSEYLTLRRQLGLDAEEQQLSIEAMRARIPESGAIVQLLIAREGAAAFILSRKGNPVVKIVSLRHDTMALLNNLFHPGSGAEDNTWMPTYRRYVGNTERTTDRPTRSSPRYHDWSAMIIRALRVLGELIFDPVHDALVKNGLAPAAEVIICPPGELACLPLSMARLSDGSEFGQHWSVSVAPRLAILPSKDHSASPNTVLVISPSAAAANWWDNLPFAKREARLVKDRFAREARIYLPPGRVKLDKVLRGLEKASVIHAACHGKYDWSEPEKSWLRLAGDQRLTVRMLSSSVGFMRNARLVFLSACESGIAGASQVPDEFTGLPISFLQAGVRAVIGSLWHVFDDAAMLICDRFYHYYLDAQGHEIRPPARALSLAQAWLRQVTVRELHELGYFRTKELEQLFVERTASGASRLRGLEVSPSETAPRSLAKAKTSSQTKYLLEETQNLRPYAAAADWAAFITYGR